MPLSADAIGHVTSTHEHDVDERWVMAYSACLGDCSPTFLDTSSEAGIATHPLFSICPEWPVALESRAHLRDLGLTESEYRRSVHATHDCHVHRLVRPGDRLSTTATVLAMRETRAGTHVTTRFDTLAASGEAIATTYQGSVYRQVVITGNDAPAVALPDVDIPEPPDTGSAENGDNQLTIPIEVVAELAHTYTECARIWNPIHTDTRVAKDAGLPAIILHGSATLALSVSKLVKHLATDAPWRVRRIVARFTGMVFLPTTLRLHCSWDDAPQADGIQTVSFSVTDLDNKPVLNLGAVVLDDPRAKRQ
jgi:acyl dehydratase